MIRPLEQPDWALADQDFDAIGGLGLNAIRYSINHELFAADNPLRGANLHLLLQHVQRFNRRGMFVVIDLHTPIGLDVMNDGVERRKPGPERIKTVIESDEYYAATLDLWQAVATTLREEAGVAYELLNEPRAPSEAEGGVERFRERLQGLCEGIRSIDPEHLVLVPEQHSIEQGATEAIVWSRQLVKIDCSNVGYVFHVYEPYEFTHEGAESYDSSVLRELVEEKVAWQQAEGHAPLFVTEYGCNRAQPVAQRVAWLRDVHSLFDEYGISSFYFNYKTSVHPYLDPATMFGLYGQYVFRDEFGSETGAGYQLDSAATAAASDNGFDELLASYFFDVPATALSSMDTQPVIEELNRYASGASQ
jgi:hypothetical protein